MIPFRFGYRIYRVTIVAFVLDKTGLRTSRLLVQNFPPAMSRRGRLYFVTDVAVLTDVNGFSRFRTSRGLGFYIPIVARRGKFFFLVLTATDAYFQLIAGNEAGRLLIKIPIFMPVFFTALSGVKRVTV